MVSIEVTREAVVLQIHGSSKFWSLKSNLTIPLEHIRSVEAVKDLKTKDYLKWDAIKAGTFLPNVIAEGTFYQDENRLYVNIHEGKAGIVLGLRDDKYYEVVVETENAQETANEIQSAIAARK